MESPEELDDSRMAAVCKEGERVAFGRGVFDLVLLDEVHLRDDLDGVELARRFVGGRDDLWGLSDCARHARRRTSE